MHSATSTVTARTSRRYIITPNNYLHNAMTTKDDKLTSPENSSLPLLSLFSGAGGLDYGFKTAGFRTVLAIDINQAALDTYETNHPGSTVIPLDLSRVDPQTVVDTWEEHSGGASPVGIIGGPPCQGFSSANVRQTADDPRRQLLFKYADIVESFKDHFDIDFFAFENVPGLASRRHKDLLANFSHMCEEAGFTITSSIIDAGTFGIAQHRKRLVVVGLNKDRYPDAELQLSEGDSRPRRVDEVLTDLPEPAFCARDLKQEDIPHHPNHVAMNPKSQRFTDGSLAPGNGTGLSFKVLSWEAPSYTVAYGNNEVHIHPDCHRRLSVYEAMLLQGFPQDGYYLKGSFTDQVRLISDAVPPPLGEGIANSVLRAIGDRLGEPENELAEL